jgi:hypothetical protein
MHREVLYAYCHLEDCPGMSFLAALFTAYMESESAFFCFALLMGSNLISHRGSFLPRFPRLMVTNAIFDLLLQRRAPAVKAHLATLDICYAMDTPSWFLNVYNCLHWPPELRFRIFKHFLCYGTRFL